MAMNIYNKYDKGKKQSATVRKSKADFLANDEVFTLGKQH